MALKFKRILCPMDLSSFSLEALKLAVRMAQNSPATLYLLHVIDNPFDELYTMTPITQIDPAARELYEGEASRRSQILQETVAHSQTLLKQFCHPYVHAIPISRVRYLVETGDPFDKILDVTETRKIDLIILATHGRTGLKRLIIGNVAEKVVRHAPCPVLTVKGPQSRTNAKD